MATYPLTGYGLMGKRHWTEFCPQMVKELEAQGRLEEALYEAQEATCEEMMELRSRLQKEQSLTPQRWTFAQPPRELRGGFASAKWVGASSLALAPAQSARGLGRRAKGLCPSPVAAAPVRAEEGWRGLPWLLSG